MAVITTNTVSIRCVGHNGRATLKDAVSEGWRMCRVCLSFICPKCIKEFDLKMGGVCPSFIFGIEKHQLSLAPIPVEKVLVFVEENKTEGITAGLLETLFYEDEQMGFIPFYATMDDKPKKDGSIEEDNAEPPKIQEEIWASFGFVMTKRRRGKFITWEKIG